MIETVAAAARLGNVVADALPARERSWFARNAQRIFVRRGCVLVEDGRASEFLYFPVDALLVTWIRFGGNARETCSEMSGRRRVSGYASAMYWKAPETRVVAVCSGYVWRLACDAFERRAAAANHPLRVMLARLTCANLAINALRSYCEVEHNVRQRVANVVLSMATESGRSEIPATHELVAAISRIRRPSVSQVLAGLQRTGAVRTLHGHLVVLDRDALANAACPCYETKNDILERVRGATIGRLQRRVGSRQRGESYGC